MKISRVLPAVLVCVPLMALTACAGQETTTTTGPTAPASTTAGSAQAGSASTGPTTTGPTTAGSTTAGSTPAAGSSTTSPAAAGTADDKKLCESANKIGEDLKTALLASLKASNGEPSPAAYKKMLTDFNRQLTGIIPPAGTGAVATALKQIHAAAAKAAAAADPATAVQDPAWEKAGTDLAAACKAAGSSVNF